MKRLLLVLALVGCVQSEGTYVGVILDVPCEKKSGVEDCVTIVRLPDHSIYRRIGDWGTPGDTVRVEILNPHKHTRYWAPPEPTR